MSRKMDEGESLGVEIKTGAHKDQEAKAKSQAAATDIMPPTEAPEADGTEQTAGGGAGGGGGSGTAAGGASGGPALGADFSGSWTWNRTEGGFLQQELL